MKKILHSIKQTISDHSSFDWAVLGIGLTTFCLLAARTITTSSIWFDEAFSAYIVKFNFIEIARYTATDVHPPLFYWILKIWIELFGTSEVAFRSMSVMFGMTAITFGFLLVKRLFGRYAAWLSLLFFVISPMLIRYGQEARMYTLAITIVMAATYVLTFAVKSNKRSLWILYGILVSLGMWTHYFTAVVWISHWVWRLIVTYRPRMKSQQFVKAFFTRDWIIAHVVAIGLFVPWLPSMYKQLTTIQSLGFWIGSVNTDTLTNYLTNILFYLEHNQVIDWWVLIFFTTVTILAVFSVKLFKSMNINQRNNYLLIIIIAFVPVLLLFLLSLPPLKPSFVERYLTPSAAIFSLFVGVTLSLVNIKTVWRVLTTLLIVVCMVFGITNVYHYGNYNKNSNTQINTRQIIEQIKTKAQPGEPIIASSPWVFYEAVFYTSAEHPVYFIDADTDYKYSSLDMLRYNDQHKIKDLNAFSEKYPIVWYMGNSGNEQLVSPSDDWTELQKFSIHSELDKSDAYKAVQFQTH